MKLYTTTDITNINAKIATFVTAKATPATWFGTKPKNGAPWTGTITRAKRTLEWLTTNPPHPQTPQNLVEERDAERKAMAAHMDSLSEETK